MIEVFIEAETGSTEKKIHDEKTLKYIRTRKVSVAYPYPYGFIKGTTTDDGDCVDCYVLTKNPLKCGQTVTCEPVALLEMLEDGEVDNKILAVIEGQTCEIDEKLHNELKTFIETIFKSYPDAEIKIGAILPKEDALRFIEMNRD